MSRRRGRDRTVIVLGKLEFESENVDRLVFSLRILMRDN